MKIVKRKESRLRSKSFYDSHFKDGGFVECRRCGFRYGQHSEDIFKTSKGWVCEDCLDPED